MEAARSVGTSDLRILTRHVLPHVLPAVVVVLPLLASRIVLIEAGLAFLGLGDPDRVSLGFLISEAQPHLQYYWWLSVFPGLALVVMVFGFNLLGDALNDTLANRDRGVPGSTGTSRRDADPEVSLPLPHPSTARVPGSAA